MEWTFSDSVRLSLLSFSEASKACAALPGFSLFRRSLQPERIEYCRAELLPDCLVGSLAVPDKTHPLHLAFSLAFYLDRAVRQQLCAAVFDAIRLQTDVYKRQIFSSIEIQHGIPFSRPYALIARSIGAGPQAKITSASR